MTAAYLMRAFEEMYALTQTLDARDDMTASLRDNQVEVTWADGKRSETLICKPLPSDHDRLWLIDSQRRQVTPTGHPDMALDVVRHLKESP